MPSDPTFSELARYPIEQVRLTLFRLGGRVKKSTDGPVEIPACRRLRAASLAQRLLGGAGRASLSAYDLIPATESGAVAHGLSDDGQLIVACIADESTPLTSSAFQRVRVRLDIVKEAPNPAVRITACTVHLLGELVWLDGEDLAPHLRETNPDIAAVASAPRGRVGVIHSNRLVVHDACGVTALPLDEAIATHRAFPALDSSWEAHERASRITAEEMADIWGAAHAGWTAATLFSGGSAGGCPDKGRQLLCVDIDRTGLTVMSVEPQASSVAVIDFSTPANNTQELTEGLCQLLKSAAAQRAA